MLEEEKLEVFTGWVDAKNDHLKGETWADVDASEAQ